MPTASPSLIRLRRLCLGAGEALLLTHLPNLRYLVGFSGSRGALVVTQAEAVLFVPPLYREQARQEAVGAQLQVSGQEPLASAAGWLRRHRFVRVAYETQALAQAQFEQLRRLLGRGVELVADENRVEVLRAVKDDEEIARLRASVELTARVFDEVLPLVRPGVRELDLAAEIEYRMKQHGAQGPGFETMVASGARAAWPHARASGKRLKKNELVIFDMGAIVSGYHSDMSRTVYLGNPSARVRGVYAAVREALERARETVRAGVPAARVDAAARRWLAQRGYGRYFVHSTGHGLGLEVHEEPRVGPKVETRLAAGNVITLEPGVYLPGWGGVRLEDVVVVRRQGAETLTPLSTELLCL